MAAPSSRDCATRWSRLGARLSPAEPPGAAPRPWLLRPVVVVLGDAALALGVGVGIALAPPGTARYLAAGQVRSRCSGRRFAGSS